MKKKSASFLLPSSFVVHPFQLMVQFAAWR